MRRYRSSIRHPSSLSRHEGLQLTAETLQFAQPFRSCLYQFALCLEDAPTGPLYEEAKEFTHVPSGLPNQLQSEWRRLQQGDAIAFQYSYGIRETLEGFDLKPCQINRL